MHFSKRYIPQFILFTLLCWGAATPAHSQLKIIDFLKPKQDTTKKDTARKPPPPPVSTYDKVINDHFKTQHGLFTIHQYKDSIYFEIPDSLLGRDIMVINRLAKGPAGYDAFPGEELDQKTIQFEKGKDSSIRVRYDLIVNLADTANAIYKAVSASSINPVVVTFPIKAYNKDSSAYVIDVSKFLTEKSFVNDISDQTSTGKAVNAMLMKDYHVESIHTYPINVEINITKNTTSKLNQPVTLETHTSFIVLPREPMQQRIFDPRVGYFADYLYAYGDDQQKMERRSFILRWRLEPKDEDRAKWEKGELVEPKQPIVIYIDPATPKQWRPYLIQGINDWQKAFEQAGFKNAIMGKEWPANDSTMSIEDARYSWLNYFPSSTANAYGPQVHDPRSGEIIQTHIGWYHNVMSLLHNWYMIQAGAVDPKARKAKFDEELMGQLIRFVSSHEVGHTLGLRHNFGSSSRTPVDSMRSITYLKAHGHTASIMDYARFNYVAQPEDHIPEELLFPRIGEYDRWAIEWGYKSSHAKTAEEDKKITYKWITDRNAKNPRLWFGDGETQRFDPRNQTEDLGDNAVKATAYGIKNLQRILPHLPEWTREEDDTRDNLTEMYGELKNQYTRYMTHVLRNIGGVTQTLKADGQTGDVLAPVSKTLQQDAMDLIVEQVFTTPTWLLDPAVQNKVNTPNLSAGLTGITPSPNFVEDLQIRMLNSLMDLKRINMLLYQAEQFGAKAYPAEKYMITLHQAIWKELKGAGPVVIDRYHRNLQKAYLGNEVENALARSADAQETDASTMIRVDLLAIQKEIEQALPRATDLMTKAHLLDLQHRIKSATADKPAF